MGACSSSRRRQHVDAEDAREAVSDAGFPKAVVQSSSGDGEPENITVRSSKLTNDEAFEIEQALGSASPATSPRSATS